MHDLSLVESVAVDDPRAWVYVIHYARPLAHARHYYGMAHTGALLHARIRKHATGHRESAHIMRAIHREGIDWEVVALYPHDTVAEACEHERRLKKLKGGWACPLCRERLRTQAKERMRALRQKRNEGRTKKS